MSPWPYLDSPIVAAVREVARVAVEAQPFDTWKQRALEEKEAVGLARSPARADREPARTPMPPGCRRISASRSPRWALSR